MYGAVTTPQLGIDNDISRRLFVITTRWRSGDQCFLKRGSQPLAADDLMLAIAVMLRARQSGRCKFPLIPLQHVTNTCAWVTVPVYEAVDDRSSHGL